MAATPRPGVAQRPQGADRQHGQALVLGLFLVFATLAVLLLMFNTGRVVDEKMRLTNAADATAWSVATLEARALNYDAYTNRAIVANEVAIAQAISLISWMHYFETAVENAPNLNQVAASWLMAGVSQRALKRLPTGSPALPELPYLLAELPEPGVMKLLGMFIAHRDPEAVAAAIEALVEIGDPAGARLLAALAGDERTVELADEGEGDDAASEVTIGELASEALELLQEGEEDEGDE